jgi:hypothetical protein
MINAIFLCNFKHFGYEALEYLVANDFKPQMISSHSQDMHKVIKVVGAGSDSIILTPPEMVKTVFPVELKNRGCTPLPVDRKVLEEMVECQSLFVPMMQRLNYTNLSTIKITEYYHRYLSFWNGVFKSLNPDILIFHNTPHEGYNFVAYHLAQQLGIKTLMPERALMSNRFFFLDEMYRFPIYDPLTFPTPLTNSEATEFGSLNRIQERTKQAFKKKTYIDNFFPRFKNKISRMIDLLGYDYDPIFSLQKSYPSKLISNIIDIRSKYLLNKLRKWYVDKSITPDLESQYIYFPLHLQPERTTLPMGRHYWSHQLVLDSLLSAIPDNCKIYIKDHPRQFTRPKKSANTLLVRDVEFYERLIENKNVYLIDLEYDSGELAKSSMCVATITGTAGWEALLKGTPVCVFGYPWYVNCPEIFKFETLEGLKIYLNKIFKGDIEVNQENLNAYSYWLKEELCYSAALDTQIVDENTKENSIAIAQAMIDAVSKSLQSQE